MRTMRRVLALSFILGAPILLGVNLDRSNSGSDSHAGEKGQHQSLQTSTSARTALILPSEAKEGLKLTMREHLEAIHAIVAALAKEDFTKAAMLAHEELGFPKHHTAMEREEGATFPPVYHDLAMTHHSAAEALSDVILTNDLKQILPKLEQTIHACVTCHQTFRL